MERQFDNVKINVEFEEAKNRQQISSGDSANTLFGKIAKWLSDLKMIAFTGSYNDLTDMPEYQPKESGIYKIAIDSAGNISAATPVTKQDLLDFGIITEYDFKVKNGELHYEPKQEV